MQLCMSHLIVSIFQCHSDRVNFSMLPGFLMNHLSVGGGEPIYITSLSILNKVISKLWMPIVMSWMVIWLLFSLKAKGVGVCFTHPFRLDQCKRSRKLQIFRLTRCSSAQACPSHRMFCWITLIPWRKPRWRLTTRPQHPYQPVSGSLSGSCTKLDADSAVLVGALLFVVGANSSIPGPWTRCRAPWRPSEVLSFRHDWTDTEEFSVQFDSLFRLCGTWCGIAEGSFAVCTWPPLSVMLIAL